MNLTHVLGSSRPLHTPPVWKRIVPNPAAQSPMTCTRLKRRSCSFGGIVSMLQYVTWHTEETVLVQRIRVCKHTNMWLDHQQPVTVHETCISDAYQFRKQFAKGDKVISPVYANLVLSDNDTHRLSAQPNTPNHWTMPSQHQYDRSPQHCFNDLRRTTPDKYHQQRHHVFITYNSISWTFRTIKGNV